MDVSILIPVFNEVESLENTFAELLPVMENLVNQWEIVVIDDGSDDGSDLLLERIHSQDPRVKILTFTSNFGKAAALAAGGKAATGDVIVTFDADGQDDPHEIHRLLDAIRGGLDCVSGWRHHRQDSVVRRLPSRVANWLIRSSTGVRLRDYGCGLKAYRSEYFRDIELIGEMHRMTPILIRNLGGTVGELTVNHRPRRAGTSKYGLSRTPRVIADLFVARFFLVSSTKPMYLFGKFSIAWLTISAISLISSLVLKLTGTRDLVETPLPLLGIVSLMLASVTLLLGILAEILVRIHFRQIGPPYRVRSRLGI